MNNPYKVAIVGKDNNGKNIWGVVYKDKRYFHIGIPESWGTRKHATKYMVTQRLFIPWAEWETSKKDFA